LKITIDLTPEELIKISSEIWKNKPDFKLFADGLPTNHPTKPYPKYPANDYSHGSY
jgi:hypothetical protein